jgi:hypothetical protein
MPGRWGHDGFESLHGGSPRDDTAFSRRTGPFVRDVSSLSLWRLFSLNRRSLRESQAPLVPLPLSPVLSPLCSQVLEAEAQHVAAHPTTATHLRRRRHDRSRMLQKNLGPREGVAEEDRTRTPPPSPLSWTPWRKVMNRVVLRFSLFSSSSFLLLLFFLILHCSREGVRARSTPSRCTQPVCSNRSLLRTAARKRRHHSSTRRQNRPWKKRCSVLCVRSLFLRSAPPCFPGHCLSQRS